MSKKWKIRHTTEEATTEVAFLFQDENVAGEIKRILKLLAEQDDPRHPHPSSGLVVGEIEYDAPGWFRVKILRYGIRIVFILLIVDGEKVIQVKGNEPIPDDKDEYYIEIMQAGYRKDVYGEELRRRYRKYNKSDE